MSIISNSQDVIINSHVSMPKQFRRRKLSLSLQSTASEHLPSINSQRHRLEKCAILSMLLIVNFAISIMFVNLSKYYWVLIPIILFRPLLDCLEISLLIFYYFVRRANPITPAIPQTAENLVYLLTCYNESGAELRMSLDSLVEQRNLEKHKKVVVIVCDGRCNGRGMVKTTADQLAEDIIEDVTTKVIGNAYTAWDGVKIGVELISGNYKGLRVLCIVKEENRGKRDSLILARSFLYKFNRRDSNQSLGVFSRPLFAQMRDFFLEASIGSVEYVVGMDADTRFDQDCVLNLVQTVRENEKIVGVCGYVVADPTTSHPFSIPYLYQSVEYKIGQHRRRLRQNLMTRKVTCLPGCCQLLRVNDTTCSDEILAQFGYYPTRNDALFRTIQSMMSEDRDHICLVLRENEDIQTRQCLTARAYTSVPSKLSVFLSQRRRWTLGPIVSDSLLATRRSTGWMERFAAVASLLNWTLTLTMFFSEFVRQSFDPRTSLLLFLITASRNIWDYAGVLLASRTLLEVFQNLIGCFLCRQFGRVVSTTIHCYSLYYLDDFRWGKMREKVENKKVKE